MPLDPVALARRLSDTDDGCAGGADALAGALRCALEAADVLLGCTGTGLMLADAGQVRRDAGATAETGRALQRVQEDDGEGPGVDAFANAGVVRVDDLVADARYPEVGHRAVGLGVRSVLGVPLRLGGGVVGTFSAYFERPHASADRESADAAFNRVVEGLLANAVVAEQKGRMVDQLQSALDRRAVVERAVGLLMGRDGLDAVAAFNRLGRVAQNRQRTVVEIANELVRAERLGAREAGPPDGFAARQVEAEGMRFEKLPMRSDGSGRPKW